MAYTATTAGNLGVHLASARINWLTDPIKIMLCTVTFVPNKDTTIWKSDVTNELPTANGYTLRGQTLASKTLVYNPATDTTTWDAADPVWTTGAGQQFTYRVYVIYKDTGTDSTSPVITWGVESTDQNPANGGTATIVFDTNGILQQPT